MKITDICNIKYGKKIPLVLNDIHNLTCIYLYGNKRLLYNIENNIYLISFNSSHYYKDIKTDKMNMIKKGFFLVDIDIIFKIPNGATIIPKELSFIKKKTHFFKIYYPYDITLLYNNIHISQKNKILDLIRKIKLNYIKNL